MPDDKFARRIRFLVNRIKERLWVKPLIICLLSVVGVLLAKIADIEEIAKFLPKTELGSIKTLLTLMASSMLIVATFAVASMLSAYASVSRNATPRSFILAIADDRSQNALSTFIGSFIFSIVALIAATNDYFQSGGRFVLFILIVIVFALVIFTFVRWVDRIARLGRLQTTIDKVEQATTESLQRRRDVAGHNAKDRSERQVSGRPIYSESVGYLQRVDVAAIGQWAEKNGAEVKVMVSPGAFITPEVALAELYLVENKETGSGRDKLKKAFLIGKKRIFDEDPRFGLLVLSQIAQRALSPAINDPGTAIDIIGVLVRIFILWSRPDDTVSPEGDDDRVEFPALKADDMFDDAFTAIGRDGAGMVEVAGTLQRALRTLAATGDAEMKSAAIRHARTARKRAKIALKLSADLKKIQDLSRFADGGKE